MTSQHGLSCDNLVRVELVTPGGAVVLAGEEEDAELLWGLRGGGGNFGVATRLEFRLYPLDGAVGGRLTYRGADVRDAVRRFRDTAAEAPRDLSIQGEVGLDESHEPIFTVLPCYTGTSADPDVLATLRAAPGLVDDGVRAHGFLDQQRVYDPPYGETRGYWKGHFVRELTDELIDELVRLVVAFGRPTAGILLESLHGAPKDVDPAHGAVGYRHAAFNVSAMPGWQDPGLDEEHIAWVREAAAAIEPWSYCGGYANYMQADEPLERIRGAYGDESFARLQELKSRYDPQNVLRRNQNIPPLPAEAAPG